MPRIRKKTSKRAGTNQRTKIHRKAAETRKKQKRAAKTSVQWKSKHKKDPGIPNNFPYKDQILAEVAEQRRQAAEEKQRRKESKKGASAQSGAGDADGDEDEDDGQVPDGVRSLSSRTAGPAPLSTKEDDDEQGDADMDVDGQGAVPVGEDMPTLAAVVEAADVVIQVLDARDPLSYRSAHLERACGGKPVLFVLNKCDLCPREAAAAWLAHLRAGHGAAAVLFRAASAFRPPPADAATAAEKSRGKGKGKERADDGVGVEGVLEFLYERAGEKEAGEALTVAVVGVTNSGKSSLINTLLRNPLLPVYSVPSSSQGPSTTTSPASVVIANADKPAIRFIDTPGLAWRQLDEPTAEEEEDTERVRARDILVRNRGRIERLKDPLPPVKYMVSRAEPEGLMLLYGLPAFSKGDGEGFLAALARSRLLTKKDGSPDQAAAARIVLRDWSTSRIPYYTVPKGALPSSALSEGDEEILGDMATRKEMRKARGVVRFGEGEVERREVGLEEGWGNAEGEGEESEEEGEEVGEDGSEEDERENEDEDDENNEVDDEETPPPQLLFHKRKRAAKPLSSSKKVSFAGAPKESRQARRGASTAESRRQRAPGKRAAKTAAAESGMKKGKDEAYDFGQFF